MEGLATKPRSGRPAKTTPEYARLLGEVIEKEPQEFGYGFAVWTVERLVQHLEKETGIGLSESRLLALMKREGYRYRRPKNELKELKIGRWRRYRAHLCGRNHADAGSTVASLLDESRTAEAYPCHSAGFQAEAACVWRLQLAAGSD